MKIEILIVASALIVGVVCYDNTTLGDLPSGVAAQLLSLLANGTIEATGSCGEPQESDIKLELYTRNNVNNTSALNMTNPTGIDSSKKTILLIHGWVASAVAVFVPDTTNAYLSRYDANVITVDWAKLSEQFYSNAVCSVPKIAELVADFLCLLNQKLGMPLDTVHIVGHSLGAHMAGFIGQDVAAKCGKQIGRITGLDPAGPLYQGLPTSQRLDKSDAIFVDVIHTNGGVLGYLTNCGHADFYVNCGTIQLGCPEIDLSLGLASLLSIPVSILSCNHVRSLYYMQESILYPDHFPSRGCSTCPLPCLPNLLPPQNAVVMGENCPNSANGGYVLATNFNSPYGG